MTDETLTPGYENAIVGLTEDRRSLFINRTYFHLAAAILAFIVLEMAFFGLGIAEPMAYMLLSMGWLPLLGAFIVVAWIGSHIAHTTKSLRAQYIALGIYVLAEALIFLPMLHIAMSVSPEIVEKATIVTLVSFGALTAVAFATGKDFSFLRSFLMWGGVMALGLIVMGVLVGFHLGTYFTIGMIGFAGAAILYDTSNIIHHYQEDRYVAAALELFASVALLFWYVLRFFLSRE